ncbi:MAG: hypothetical protein EON54_26825, partial [Alcaligenaceae bacterium]
MAGFWQLASMLREQVNATAWRSDVLKPLAWLIGIVGTLMAALVFAKAQEWLLGWIGIAFLMLIGLYAACYVICLFVDRDALRSEGYSLNKMAIEHKLLGDSTAGMSEVKDVNRGLPVTAEAPK